MFFLRSGCSHCLFIHRLFKRWELFTTKIADLNNFRTVSRLSALGLYSHLCSSSSYSFVVLAPTISCLNDIASRCLYVEHSFATFDVHQTRLDILTCEVCCLSFSECQHLDKVRVSLRGGIEALYLYKRRRSKFVFTICSQFVIHSHLRRSHGVQINQTIADWA